MITQEMDKITHTKEEMVARFEAERKKWGVKLDEINERIAKVSESAKENVKADYKRGLEDLKAKYEIAQKRLSEFTASGGDKWEGFKGDMETLWKDIEVTFKKLTH